MNAPENSTSTRFRILIVDDDEFNRIPMKSLLELRGFDVLAAENGKIAMELISKNSINFLMVDYLLPDIDGLELLKKMKSSIFIDNCFCLCVTGYEQTEFNSKAADAGFDLVMQKPIDLKNVFELIEQQKNILFR